MWLHLSPKMSRMLTISLLGNNFGLFFSPINLSLLICSPTFFLFFLCLFVSLALPCNCFLPHSLAAPFNVYPSLCECVLTCSHPFTPLLCLSCWSCLTLKTPGSATSWKPSCIASMENFWACVPSFASKSTTFSYGKATHWKTQAWQLHYKKMYCWKNRWGTCC